MDHSDYRRNFAVVVPTLNAGPRWKDWLASLAAQTVKPNWVVVLDSESTDDTPAMAKGAGHQIVTVARAAFDHGGTRQYGLEILPEDVDILVYLTQDAVLSVPNALEIILAAFAAPDVGLAYGRQLPRVKADPIEAHARLFNYPPADEVRDFNSRAQLGIKAAFCSDSFAAYRRTALMDIDGFPRRTIMGEDMLAAAKMLKRGWRVAYVSDATVYHSHSYGVVEQFRRLFDTGVMHWREAWLLEEFGAPEMNGLKFLRSEIAYLLRRAPHLAPVALLHTAAKYIGYRLGRTEARIATPVKRLLSMNKGFWRDAVEELDQLM